MRAIGIDLGTTYSCVATVDSSGKPVIIPNKDGELTTPSVVWFDGARIVVGNEAKGMAPACPEDVVSFVKRDMGSDSYRFSCDRGDLRAEEISAIILKKLVQDASEHLGEKITEAVITVPAYFSFNERQATENAAKIAGLKVIQLINEPTAAAIAYGLGTNKNSQRRHILVYDLGGGTFDVTVIAVSSEGIEVICTDGDHRLGGADWDARLISLLVDKFQMETGDTHNLYENLGAMQELQSKAERMKKGLSRSSSAADSINVNGDKVKLTVTRSEFEAATIDLLQKTLDFTVSVIDTARDKGVSHIDEIIMVGGSTRMPQVPEALQRHFNMQPKGYDPDEAVAKGAALTALSCLLRRESRHFNETDFVLEGSSSRPISDFEIPSIARATGFSEELIENINIKIVNVCSKSFGEVMLTDTGHRLFNIIYRNTPLPAMGRLRGGTNRDNQTTVQITVMENMEEKAEHIDPELGTLLWEGDLKVQPGLPQGSPIDTEFRLDESGMLHIYSHDPVSGNSIEADVQTCNSITKKELENMRRNLDSADIE